MYNLATLDNTVVHFISDLTLSSQEAVVQSLNEKNVPVFAHSPEEMRDIYHRRPAEHCPKFREGHHEGGDDHGHEEGVDEPVSNWVTMPPKKCRTQTCFSEEICSTAYSLASRGHIV